MIEIEIGKVRRWRVVKLPEIRHFPEPPLSIYLELELGACVSWR